MFGLYVYAAVRIYNPTILTLRSTGTGKRAPGPRSGDLCWECDIDLARGPGALFGTDERISGMSLHLASPVPERLELTSAQTARKKLETRRLAYDTSLVKMQKAKKEDFRVEEELRSQKAKYEESSEDVFRRMQDIKESEVELVQDLSDFLEAQLTYYDRCREILLNVKREWPVR